MQRRALTAALASVTVTLGGALAATPTAPAQAEDPAVSPLVLRAPDQVTVKSYGRWVYSTFGIRLRAKGQNFEIQATREPGTSGVDEWWDPSYNSPITAVWKRWNADGTPAADVPLPEGSMTTWQGLDDFASIKIFRASDGQRVRTLRTPGCFNGEARRMGPAAPLENPYPWGCPWNPFTLGSVMGIPQASSTTLLSPWGSAMRLRPGTYDLVAEIAPSWRDTFGISEADGVASTTLVVEKVERRSFRRSAATLRARTSSGTDELGPVGEEPNREAAGKMPDAHAPDLRALPAFEVGLNAKGTAMRFGATVWNGGAGPMVIEGFRNSREADHMRAYQYYLDEDGNRTGYEEVGELHFHEGNHHHWHFEDFARYRLLAPDATNPNLPGEAVVRSTKQSFCLVATDAVDLTVPNADMRPEYTDLGSQCGGPGALSLREVLANGHGDTYYQYRTGQAFRLGNVPDGRYFIAVEANPDDANGRNLRELDYDNNTSYRKVRLFTNANGVRKVRMAKVGIVDERRPFEGFRTR